MADRGNLFNHVKLRKPKTNGFNMNYQLLTTGNMGDLIPITCQEVIPGDIWRGRSEVFCRLMPMLRPIMQRVDIYTHYFLVPNRLLWNISKQKNSWQAFITGGEDGKQTPEPPNFQMTSANILGVIDELPGAFDTCSLWDYFNLPTQSDSELRSLFSASTSIGSNEKVLLYPFLAYQLIYDEYYRDQNYTEPILDSENMQGGTYPVQKLVDLFTLRKRSWKKDYFTSALPWAQRGENVEFALGQEASLSGQGEFNVSSLRVNQFYGNKPSAPSISGVTWQESGPLMLGLSSVSDVIHNLRAYQEWVDLNSDGTSGERSQTTGNNMFGVVSSSVPGASTVPVNMDNVNVDLSGVSAINVQMLREGLRLQEWLERNSVGGARYVEQIFAHFGVMVPDATIQRPIYLGGGKQTVRISEVLQSVENMDNDTPLGDMAGHGISVGRTRGFDNRKFTEHGFIIGIMSVVPKASYMDGLSRMWTRLDKLDYYFPEFAHLGEQEVKIKELVFRWNNQTNPALIQNRNNDTFGYQSRYAEYKYNEDRISGEFRTTLRDWHLGRHFGTQFDNNADFLEIQPQETERIFAVQDNGATSKLLFQIYHEFDAIRPMPKFATPYI